MSSGSDAESSPRFYLEQFERQKAKGTAAYRAGDAASSRAHFLRAAEHLFQLAKLSKGKLRAQRVANARKMIELSKQVKERPAAKPKPAAEEPRRGPVPALEKPTLRFDDIAGLEDVKEQIRIKMILPFTHPEKAKTYRIQSGGGVLLYGPPGTGKTMIGRAVASELDAPFFAIAPSDILNKWVGESEKNVRALFESARQSPRAVIFIDEVESLTPKRRDAEAGGVMQRVVPQILAELDGVQKKDGSSLLFLGATNEPWNIDTAILRPGRLDEKIYVGLPDPAARRKILELNLAGVPLESDVDLDALAARLEGYSGADVAYLCRRTCESVFRAVVEQGTERPVARLDFESVLDWLKPSVSDAEIDRFTAFREGREA